MAVIDDLVWSTLASTPANPTTDLTFSLATGDGAIFAATNFPKKALLCPPGVVPTKANSERVLIVSRSADTVTVQKRDAGNWNSNTGRSVQAGWIIMNTPFADDFFNVSIVVGETPGGAVNGTNTAFTLASAYRGNSLKIYKNGIRLKGGAGNDYTETATGFTLAAAPASGAVLVVDYEIGDTTFNVGGNSIISDEQVTGTVNGTNPTFTTNRAYIATSLEVYVDGVHQIRGVDFNETTPSTGVFTFTAGNIPVTNANIRVNYQYNLNPSSNSDTVDGQHAAQLAPVGIFQPYAGRFAPSGWLNCDGSAVSRTSYPDLFNTLCPVVGQPTITIATPGVLTLLNHGLLSGDTVYLTTSGALPTGLSANTLYFVVNATTNTFQLSATRGGTAIATSGTQSGTHNAYYCPYGLGNGTSTFNVPDMRGRAAFGADAQGGTAAGRMSLATAQGIAGNQGASGGEQSHVQTLSELASHAHTIAGAAAVNNGSQVGVLTDGGTTRVSASNGSSAAANIVPPGLIANYIIKAL